MARKKKQRLLDNRPSSKCSKTGPKSVKIGQKSGLFESPSKTEIRSSFDENHLVKACQNLDRLKNCQKMHKRAQPSPKSVKIGQKSGFFSSPSKLKFAEFWTKIRFFKNGKFRLKLPKNGPKNGPNGPKKAQSGVFGNVQIFHFRPP